MQVSTKKVIKSWKKIPGMFMNPFQAKKSTYFENHEAVGDRKGFQKARRNILPTVHSSFELIKYLTETVFQKSEDIHEADKKFSFIKLQQKNQ